MTYLKENNFCKFYLKNYILTISVKTSQPADEDWDNTIKIMKSFYEAANINKFKFSIIFDLKLMGLLSYNKIKEWGDLFIDYREKTKEHIICTAIITDSFIIKNTLNLFFNIYTTVRPMKMVDNINDAYIFIKQN